MINNFDRIVAVEANRGSIIIDKDVSRDEFEKRYSFKPFYIAYYGYDPEIGKDRDAMYSYRISQCDIEGLRCDIYVIYEGQKINCVLLYPINEIIDRQEKEAGNDTQRKIKVFKKRKGICDYWLKNHCGEPKKDGESNFYIYPNETVSTCVLEVSNNIGQNTVIGGGINISYNKE